MNIYRGEWTEFAACAGMDTGEVFATNGHERHDAKKILNAKKICAGCSVRAECETAMLGWPTPPYRIVIAGMAPSVARRRWFDAHADEPTVHFKLDGSPCGTNRGHQRHIRHGEKPCAECRIAHNVRVAQDRKLA